MGSTYSSQRSESMVWVWKSNSNPWSDDEAEKWTVYPVGTNRIIEDAFLTKKPYINIQGYGIDFNQMIQYNKANKSKQRPVRRLTRQSFIKEQRGKRFSGAIANIKRSEEGFGNIKDFIAFLISKSEALRETINKCRNLDEQTRVQIVLLPSIIISIKDTAKILGEKEVEEAKTLLEDLMKSKKPSTLQEFAKVIVKAYTEETFLYYKLNTMLYEDWERLESLILFAYYLIYSLDLLFEEEHHWRQIADPKLSRESYALLGFSESLYRGAYLSEEELELYDPKNEDILSWNSFVSVSRSKEFAQSFIMVPRKGYHQVFFRIDFEFSFTRKVYMIAKYSSYKWEDEVILPPGTTFGIVSKEFTETGYYVHLRIVSEGESTKRSAFALENFSPRYLRKTEDLTKKRTYNGAVEKTPKGCYCLC